MKTISMIVAVTIAMGALLIPLSMTQANADTLCKFTKENQRCDLDIDRVNGNFKLSIVNEQNNSNGGGGSGNVSTVDQQARDDIAANGALDAQLVIRVDGVGSNVTAVQGEVAAMQNEIQQLRTDLQALNSSVITDISLSNGTGGVVIEPPTNDTGTGTNSTGNFTG